MSSIRLLHEKYIDGATSVTQEVANRLEKASENTLNSCVQVLNATASLQAKKIDDKLTALEEKTDMQLLEGIPFGVKDVFMVEGTTTT